MKKTLLAVFLILFTTILAAADIRTTISFDVVTKKSGKLYIAVFNSEKTYKKRDPYKVKILEDGVKSTTMMLPEGEYLISVFMDVNGNGDMDSNLVGMPKEPVGLSNYSGKGIPGNFDRLKVKIDGSSSSITIKVVDLMGK